MKSILIGSYRGVVLLALGAVASSCSLGLDLDGSFVGAGVDAGADARDLDTEPDTPDPVDASSDNMDGELDVGEPTADVGDGGDAVDDIVVDVVVDDVPPLACSPDAVGEVLALLNFDGNLRSEPRGLGGQQHDDELCVSFRPARTTECGKAVNFSGCTLAWVEIDDDEVWDDVQAIDFWLKPGVAAAGVLSRDATSDHSGDLTVFVGDDGRLGAGSERRPEHAGRAVLHRLASGRAVGACGNQRWTWGSGRALDRRRPPTRSGRDRVAIHLRLLRSVGRTVSPGWERQAVGRGRRRLAVGRRRTGQRADPPSGRSGGPPALQRVPSAVWDLVFPVSGLSPPPPSGGVLQPPGHPAQRSGSSIHGSKFSGVSGSPGALFSPFSRTSISNVPVSPGLAALGRPRGRLARRAH